MPLCQARATSIQESRWKSKSWPQELPRRTSIPVASNAVQPIRRLRSCAEDINRGFPVGWIARASRHQSQSMHGGCAHGPVCEGHDKGFTAVPVGKLVKIVGAEWIARLAHHDIFGRSIHLAP